MKEILKNKKILIIFIITLVILLLGGTYAWYIWQSSNTVVNLDICAPQISFVGGTTLNGEGLKPVTSKEKGLRKQIDVYLNKVCKEGDSAVMNLYMTLDLLPEELRHETFMFEVVKDDEVLYSGNFKDKTQGKTITLLENQVITEDDSIYFVYVYIDGTRDNPKSMSGKSFRFTVYGEGTNAIYKENVIAHYPGPSDSNSVFLTSTLKRNEIEAITLVESNEVPEELQSIAEDISSNEDGSVMLWYTDTDGDSLKEVYIGSENGIITANTNGQGMFSYLENVESLDLTRLDTSNITNMSSMFRDCSSLKTLDLSGFDTSNVTKMVGMFRDCKGLTTLDLSNFKTSNVTSFEQMFRDCSGLKTLDLSGIDTSNVTNMAEMFYACGGLKILDLSSFNTSNVTSMRRIFLNCSGLKTIYISNLWNTDAVTISDWTFMNCVSLVGGSGTTYNSSYTDKTYARVDDPTNGNPGYLTLKTV